LNRAISIDEVSFRVIVRNEVKLEL